MAVVLILETAVFRRWTCLSSDLKPTPEGNKAAYISETDTVKEFNWAGDHWQEITQATGTDWTAHFHDGRYHTEGEHGGVSPAGHHAQAHGAADHTGDVIPAANQDFGAFYSDVAQIVAPANPGAGVRRLFVDSADGKLKVRTSGGVNTSLEEQGGAGVGIETEVHIPFVMLATEVTF